ncbi:pyruvate ferredoxin oxidoreductase [uncultured Ilyobacter sp.]|uniref:pyruvate ferredoxin oxidoreductase n=1 Tax=uncultured Ilyobacter sp. TaxID=544433 RepID=UPI0029C07799|nr:pyruvate ferredoxin oxidoreductase [uncultured Ilyobacter sp.]
MAIKERMSGNESIAIAMRQINPDVLPAFPITPSTEIPQYFSKYVADGLVQTEFIPVESEHSAMSAAIGSQAAGARTTSATSSAGLALMWEMLHVAASCKLPITLACVNRALTGPININADHSDSMGARDTGWIQIYSETNQEAYDNYIQAVRIAEHKDVMLPAMVCQDGFITSHAVENIELLEDKEVREFVGEYAPEDSLLNPGSPISHGPYDTATFYMEHKRLQAESMKKAKKVILSVAEEFKKVSGREYGLFEEYRMEDAEYAMVIINSSAGTAKVAVDELRKEGKKVGLIKIRVFRPFPMEELAEALKHLKAIAVMDKSEGFSSAGGPIFAEVRSAMYDLSEKPSVVNYIYGLGGRDFTVDSAKQVYDEIEDIKGTSIDDIYRYLGVRG